MRGRTILLGLALAAGCGDDESSAPDAAPDVDAAIDADPGPDANPLMPATLAETGLCTDAACTEIAADVHEYVPEYQLWSDGATKRRWIHLPAGATIDTSNMDRWQFPEGTKLWKEFTRDGTRVETRLLMKIGPEPNDWFRATYAWNEAQDAAPLADPVYGADDVLDTDHDIPSRSDCRKCHDQLSGGVLGFGAILLDHGGPGLTLGDLVEMDWLSDPPTAGKGGAYFPIPGTPEAQAALGYLHANCGNCHNPDSTVMDNVQVDWNLRVALLASVEATPAYTTAVGVTPQLGTPAGATAILAPGDAEASAAYLRMTTTVASDMMPPLARELPDTDGGVAALAAWIAQLGQ